MNYTQVLVLYDKLVMFLGYGYNRKVVYFFLRKVLKTENDGEFLMSSDTLFQLLIADGRNELCNRFVLH